MANEWNMWVWLVGVVSRRWVWLMDELIFLVWLVGVVNRRWVWLVGGIYWCG